MSTDDAIQTILSQSAEMRDALVEIEATLRERCPGHAKRLERVELILDGAPGNGNHPGLAARVGMVERCARQIKDSMRTGRQRLVDTLLHVGSGVAVALIVLWLSR